MRVLITGAAGFAGGHLAELVREEGATVVGLGRRSRGAGILDEYLAADLRDPDDARAAVASARPDRVFHLAADASVARSWSAPAATVQANVASTLGLLEAVLTEAPAARVLIAGSGEAYGAVPAEAMPVIEDQPPAPRNPYAASKAASDLLAGFYGDARGLHVVRMRAFNHAGPGQLEPYVVASFARRIAEAERAGDSDTVTLATGDLSVKRDFTDVRDVVRAYWLALDAAPPGVYNVASGRATAVAELLDGLRASTPLKIAQQTDPALLREHEVPEIVGSAQRLRDATGWRPEIPLRRTLADALAWWRERART